MIEFSKKLKGKESLMPSKEQIQQIISNLSYRDLTN